MILVIMNKLELVRALRRIAANEGCHLTLRAALAIANWLKSNSQREVLRGELPSMKEVKK